MAGTHAEQSSLAARVAEHLLHGAVLQRKGLLNLKLVPVSGVQRAAARGLQQDVREQEEHLRFSLLSFSGHHLQAALADVPPTWNTRG